MERRATLCYTVPVQTDNARLPDWRAHMAVTGAEPQSFLTPQEVSSLLRVSVYTVRRWIKEGSLPAYKVGRGWRISETEMAHWLEQNQSSAMSPS